MCFVKISKYIKLTRLRWAGHLMRDKNKEITKKISLAQSICSRKRRRQIQRGGDEVDEGARRFGIRNW